MSNYTARKRRASKTKKIQMNCHRPRMVVFKSSTHIYVQLVKREENGDKVLASCSTVDKELKSSMNGNKVEKSKLVGKTLAERAKALNISEVAFDRAGYKYHGRVKALADGAREAGLIF